MARYITSADKNVALNGTIPFDIVSVPCNTGNVIPLATGTLILKGNTCNKSARYEVTVQGNIAVPEGGDLTAIALGVTINGVIIPDSVAIITPQAVEEYGHINTSIPINVPCGCCISVSGAYVDGTEDDAAVMPTPSVLVRRGASISVVRVA